MWQWEARQRSHVMFCCHGRRLMRNVVPFAAPRPTPSALKSSVALLARAGGFRGCSVAEVCRSTFAARSARCQAGPVCQCCPFDVQVFNVASASPGDDCPPVWGPGWGVNGWTRAVLAESPQICKHRRWRRWQLCLVFGIRCLQENADTTSTSTVS